MLVGLRAVLMSVVTMFVCRDRMLFCFVLTAVIMMMRSLTVVMGGVFMMRCRLVMMFAR